MPGDAEAASLSFAGGKERVEVVLPPRKIESQKEADYRKQIPNCGMKWFTTTRPRSPQKKPV